MSHEAVFQRNIDTLQSLCKETDISETDLLEGLKAFSGDPDAEPFFLTPESDIESLVDNMYENSDL